MAGKCSAVEAAVQCSGVEAAVQCSAVEAGGRWSPVMKAFLAGSLSGTCSTVLLQPLDLVKTRQQAALAPAPSSFRVAQSILSTGGLPGLWRGLLPSICRTVPGVGLYFSSLHCLRSRLTGRPSAAQTVLMGAGARALAATVILPVTVIKTRVECGAELTLGSLVGRQGWRGLTRGLGPTLARDVPFSGMYLAIYEWLKSIFPLQGPVSHVGAGLGAGLLAGLATHPADVVKTRMQLGVCGNKGVMSTAATLYRTGGPGAFMVGLGPRLARRTVMAALAWTVYEKMLGTLALRK